MHTHCKSGITLEAIVPSETAYPIFHDKSKNANSRNKPTQSGITPPKRPTICTTQREHPVHLQTSTWLAMNRLKITLILLYTEIMNENKNKQQLHTSNEHYKKRMNCTLQKWRREYRILNESQRVIVYYSYIK